MARSLVTGAVLVALGCGGGNVAGNVCADATIQHSCATLLSGPCHDQHGNTCIICAGPHVSEDCIYDPNAPLDGGTAACVADCSTCGTGCMPF